MNANDVRFDRAHQVISERIFARYLEGRFEEPIKNGEVEIRDVDQFIASAIDSIQPGYRPSDDFERMLPMFFSIRAEFAASIELIAKMARVQNRMWPQMMEQLGNAAYRMGKSMHEDHKNQTPSPNRAHARRKPKSKPKPKSRPRDRSRRNA